MPSLEVLRFEGPPESGKTTEACQFFHAQNLVIPTHAATGTEDVAMLAIRDLFRDPAPGKPFNVTDAEESIERVMFTLREDIKPAALLISRTRDIFAQAGEHAARLLAYLYKAAEGSGFRFLAFEDSQPSSLTIEAEALAQWNSLPWLKSSEPKYMPQCTPLQMGWLIPTLVNDVSNRLEIRFSLTRDGCPLGGYRVGPVRRIFETAARLAVDLAPKKGPILLTEDHLRTATIMELVALNREHAAALRGPLVRKEASLPLATYIATQARLGVLLKAAATLDYVETTLGRKINSAPIETTIQWLLRDRIIWLAGDGRAFLSDAMLGVRLANPDLAAKAEQQSASISAQSARSAAHGM